MSGFSGMRKPTPSKVPSMSTDVMVERESGVIGTGAGAGKNRMDSGTMKFQVVEKAPRVVERKAAVGGVVERGVQEKVKENGIKTMGVSAPVIPAVLPGSSDPLEQSMAGPSGTTLKAKPDTGKAEDNDEDDEEEDDSLSQNSFEYSDTDDVNLDLDNALLSREAALAYHHKRSQLGRTNLGGWTGITDDGETEFYDGDTGDIVAKNQALTFGEQVIPKDRYEKIRKYMETDGGEGDGPLPAEVGEAEAGGVVLPTLPLGEEELKDRFKVGRLENGNLVIAGENIGDESEGEEVGETTLVGSTEPGEE